MDASDENSISLSSKPLLPFSPGLSIPNCTAISRIDALNCPPSDDIHLQKSYLAQWRWANARASCVLPTHPQPVAGDRSPALCPDSLLCSSPKPLQSCCSNPARPAKYEFGAGSCGLDIRPTARTLHAPSEFLTRPVPLPVGSSSQPVQSHIILWK
jgi:hypothetical protein